ncbi:hypothetical protein ACFVWG_22285 [Kribbella sp. NPDC058245]|uniref:hypothetical protein n=1 Tax=Kribbella sp. NPDC058245 TaxID=3346399 RepID=UPI0036ECACC0
MTFRRVQLAAGVVLAGLALTLSGCSDSGSTDAGKQPTTQQSAPTAPTAPTSAPSDDGADKASDQGGDSKDFCTAFAAGSDAIRKWNEPQSDPEYRAKLVKQFQDLADKAPSELTAPMQVIADAYEKIQSGQVKEDDEATITKYAGALQTVNTWIVANCADFKPSTPAGG